MVDFNKKIINSSKFRQAAIFFLEHKCYTLAPPGTTDYINYWELETLRCLNGYVAPDGDAITGYHYFYLNYFPILRLVKTLYKDKFGNTKTKRVRTLEFADFYDYDYYYFNAIEQAEEEGKHMIVLKARNKGYSFKGASMLVRNYSLIKESQNFALASDKGYLTQDGLLTKAWAGMDFIDKNTAWAKQRLRATQMERMSGYKITDEFGKQIEAGYKSAIIGKTLKDDPDKARGIRGKLILWEEAGNFKDILAAWQIARESVEEAGEQVGLMIAYGTGGTEGANFDGLKEMFYHPKGYNVFAMPNIWDEKAEDQECGFFVPAYANLSTLDKETLQRVYMDDDGNTLKEKSIEFCMKQRSDVRDGASSEVTVDRFIAENPLTPQESILEIGGNIFPKKLLMLQLAKIRTNKKLQNLKHVVDLTWDGSGGVVATEKKSGDITEYPLKKDDKPEGSVVIWEYPIVDPPFGLYIGGCLTPGEKVRTLRGLVNVEEVALGDKLVNKEGKYVDIKNIQLRDKSDENTYRIKPTGSYRTTNFTSQHPIWTGNRGFVKAEDITCEDWLEIKNEYESDLEYYLWNESSLRELKYAYFFGLFTGDGFTNINGNSYDIYMSIGKEEKEFAEFYDNLILELFGKKCVRVHKNREQTRRFTDKNLVLILDKSVGISAYTKRVPEWIKKGSYGIKMAFLQGFLDSDGSVFKDKGKIRANFTSVNLELLEDIQDMLFGLHIKNSIVSHQKPRVNKQNVRSILSYRINISFDDNLKLTFKPIYESRKIKLLRESKNTTSKLQIKFINGSIWLKVQNIDKQSYTGTVYNFECDTHTFGCRCIMTHNCDPYDHDESFTNSLGSTFIFKRVRAGEAWNDVIVAEYSGRPATAEEYYENVRKLLTFYNARLLFENERKGIYPYFTNKHCDYLLADQPDKIITEIFKDSKVLRRKGCHMTKQIRLYGEGLIKEWLEEEYEPGHPNLERIYSEPLLEELIWTDGERNVDRVIALCMVMLYREELYQVRVTAAKEKNKLVELFELPLFGSQYWTTEELSTEDDIPLFTF